MVYIVYTVCVVCLFDDLTHGLFSTATQKLKPHSHSSCIIVRRNNGEAEEDNDDEASQLMDHCWPAVLPKVLFMQSLYLGCIPDHGLDSTSYLRIYQLSMMRCPPCLSSTQDSADPGRGAGSATQLGLST